MMNAEIKRHVKSFDNLPNENNGIRLCLEQLAKQCQDMKWNLSAFAIRTAILTLNKECNEHD